MQKMIFKYGKINLVRWLHNKSFAIAKATVDDKKEILKLMEDVFYKSDPSSIYSSVSSNPKISPTVENLTAINLSENISFVARENEKDKKIIGVAINGLRDAVLQNDFMDSFIQNLSCPKEKTLLEMWKFISLMPPDSAKVFEGEKSIWEVSFLAVDPGFRQRGVGKALFKRSIKEANAMGIKFVRVDCTSNFTTRIAASLGMKCVYEINYTDYKNPKGEKILKDIKEPHTKMAVYVGKDLK